MSSHAPGFIYNCIVHFRRHQALFFFSVLQFLASCRSAWYLQSLLTLQNLPEQLCPCLSLRKKGDGWCMTEHFHVRRAQKKVQNHPRCCAHANPQVPKGREALCRTPVSRRAGYRVGNAAAAKRELLQWVCMGLQPPEAH